MIKDAKKSQDGRSDLTCLAVHVCNEALPEDIHVQSGVPLPADRKTSLCPRLAWEDLQVVIFFLCEHTASNRSRFNVCCMQWGATSLVIEAKHINEDARTTIVQGDSSLSLQILRMHWLKVTSPS